MRRKRLFEISDSGEVAAQLIEAVPSNWSWVDGHLRAPETLINSGEVVRGSGFALQRFNLIHPTIIGKRRDDQKISPADFYGLIAERKLPEFLRFDEAAYETKSEGLTMEVVKKIAAAYVRHHHYQGWLCFYSNCCNNHKYDNPATSEIRLAKWSPPPFLRNEYPDQEYPPTIELTWNTEFGGKEENLGSILSICKQFGLRELVLGLC